MVPQPFPSLFAGRRGNRFEPLNNRTLNHNFFERDPPHALEHCSCCAWPSCQCRRVWGTSRYEYGQQPECH
ncbi:hypothetical protein LENED_012053 [Lentinula edodes]|uniref:Uncharacterized protein n=1 Tax=Lentinula edodes TaxID=5353 RepID=A0A1Q3ERP2_LENED|nr:hypothetical protein LENED_012053 [Lentinula edodes]